MRASVSLPGRGLSARTLLILARAVRDGRPFRADDAFLLVREARPLCPVSPADVLSGLAASRPGLSALDGAEDGAAYVGLLARRALAELIVRLEAAEAAPPAPARASSLNPGPGSVCFDGPRRAIG